MARFEPFSTAPQPERALLVGVETRRSIWPIDESLDELERLANTDGAVVVGRLTQRLEHPVPKTFIGSGKAQEVKELVKTLSVDVVIFDDELSPSQQANLEHVVGEPVKVIDRTALILDIFGNHATTREGRLQVQLAQLIYLLPRLRGMWSHLVGEQTRGGIGSRFGQGESQLEVDRRMVRNRIATLRDELERLERRRDVQAKARDSSGVYRVALAGYTNAGKSTLLNCLTGANVYVRDELFATLDPTTRMLELDEGRKITITDTVGFIQKLPTTLVESFKSTLAEVLSADLILLVVDAHDPNASKQVEAVSSVLEEIGAQDIPQLLVQNKIDLLDADQVRVLAARYPDAVMVSALDGVGMGSLRMRIAQVASAADVTRTVLIPYTKGALMRDVHERCQVISERYEQEGMLATVRVPQRMLHELERYAIEPQESASNL